MSIQDNDFLLRRVFFKDPNYVKEDGSITSLAFKPRQSDNKKLSVDVERLTTYEKSVQDTDRFRLGKLPVSIPIATLNMSVQSDPLPENEAHALIIGEFTKAECRTLAANTVLISTL